MSDYILIVEDDNDISNMLKELLQQNGYRTAQAFSGTEALFYIERELPDALILDLMLPGMNGEELLLKLKQEHPEVAVIISSAKDEIKTRVELLRAGADDYIVKPFDVEEILARLEAVLRRVGKDVGSHNAGGGDNGNIHGSSHGDIREAKGAVLQYKDILMESEEFRVTVSGTEVRFTRREYLILELLMRNPGKVFTKNNIYESVWNEEFLGEDNAVNVHISNIRQKLAKVNDQETYIETVWGIGFKMK